MLPTSQRTKIPTVVGAVLALFFGLLMFSAPAQAADVGVTLTPSSTTVQAGETYTLSWTATDSVTSLEAGDDWSGSKAIPSGSEEFTAVVGTHHYTLMATDGGEATATAEATVTVTAAPADPTSVTPAAVTFPGACTVNVPATTGVKYTVTVDGETSDVATGTYSGIEFLGEDEDTAIFHAVALNDDYVIAPGATVTWTYDPIADCGDLGNDTLVSAKATCSAVTFTNVTDETVSLYYGDVDEDDADGYVTIPAGSSRKVATARAELAYEALTGTEEELTGLQIDFIAVPQNCGVSGVAGDPSVAWPVKHPSKAPAAGVSGDSRGSSLPVVALLSVLALVATRRAYRIGR